MGIIIVLNPCFNFSFNKSYRNHFIAEIMYGNDSYLLINKY